MLMTDPAQKRQYTSLLISLDQMASSASALDLNVCKGMNEMTRGKLLSLGLDSYP